MDSVRFDGEDESKPGAADRKKHKLPKKLLDDCGAVNHASVPRKLRSDIKKRGRESIVPPLPISRKKLRASNGVETMVRENGAKKFRQKMKQKGHITKDEKEVAETLYSLADMFSNIAKTKNKKPVLEGELTKTKSSTKVESGSSSKTAAEDAAILRPQEESRKMNTKVALEAVLVNSTAEVVKTRTSDNAELSESPFGEQSPSTSASRVQSDLSLGLRFYDRSKMSTPDAIQSCERTIAMDQVDSRIPKYGKHHYPKENKFKGVFRSPSLSPAGVLSSEMQKSCIRFLTWFENTNSPTPLSTVTENGVAANKIHYPQVVPEPGKPKSCPAHVSIARLIKVMQKSRSEKGLLQKPAQLTRSGCVEQGPYLSIDNQKRIINGANGVLPFNGFTHSASDKDLADENNAILSYKKLLLDQQQASKTSAMCSSQKQGSDYFSLGAGSCSSDVSEGINRAGSNFEAKQNHLSYWQPQNHSTMLFSQPQNGYFSAFHGRTSAAAASQVQLSPYLGNTAGSSVIVPPGDQLDSFQQKWTAQLSSQYNSPSLQNYAQAFSPHFHSAVSSKYQNFSHPQQLLTLSNLERHYGRLNSAHEKNGAAFHPDNLTQLQLLCNQRL